MVLTALQIAELLLHHREKSRLVYQATMGWGFLGCGDTLPQASLEQSWLRLVAAKVFLRGLDLVQQIVFRRWRFELQPALETHADSGLALWSLKDDIRIAKICLLRESSSSLGAGRAELDFVEKGTLRRKKGRPTC